MPHGSARWRLLVVTPHLAPVPPPLPRVLNMHALQAFIVVAEQRSFARAAQVLIIDASTASKLVRTLEREFGARLLLRSTRQVQRLTPHGELVLSEGRRLLELSERLRSAVESCSPEADTGTVCADELGAALPAGTA